jgi:hypothetical protein
VKWKAFQHDGKTYDLTHLHPRTFRFERPAEGTRPAEVYKVDTIFTSHCFTRQPKKAESYNKNLLYSDGYESRLFDFRRYGLSKQLPEIVQTMPARKPYHNSNRRNFFTVEVLAESGNLVEYDIFFKLRKTARGRLEMIVETAFVRDPEYDSIRPAGKPIRFWIILHNTLNNIGIRA